MHRPNAIGTFSNDGHRLTMINEWYRFASPKNDDHWKDYRSAKENARAWIVAAPDLQPDVAQVLENIPDIGALRFWSTKPEVCILTDRHSREQKLLH